MLCIWVFGMAAVLVLADGPMGRALGIVAVCGLGFAAFLAIRRGPSR